MAQVVVCLPSKALSSNLSTKKSSQKCLLTPSQTSFSFFVCLFVTRFHYVIQAGLKLLVSNFWVQMILPPPPPEFWDNILLKL
jgi:hypothetical protein